MKRILSLIAISAILFTGCSRDYDESTDCEIINSTIQQYVTDFSLTTVNLYSSENIIYFNKRFELIDNFIVVDGEYYNICLVKRFGREDRSLQIHF